MKQFLKNNFQRRSFLIYIFLFISAFSIRLYSGLFSPIYGDEITWIVRGKELIYSLLNLNFNYFSHAWWLDTTETQALSIPLTFLSGASHIIFSGNGNYSFHWFSDIFAARLPIIILNSFLPPLIYFYGSKFFNKKVAFLAAILLLINPVVTNIDSWVLNDSLLTLFSFLSVMIFLDKVKNIKFSLWPGLFLGLALLTKPTGVLPVIFWIFAYIEKRNIFNLRMIFGNLIFGYLVTLILWPGAWINPIIAFPEYLLRQATLVKVDISVFYMGRITVDPGWGYYFVQFLMKMPEMVIFGLAVFTVKEVKEYQKKYFPRLLEIFAYIVVMLVILNLSANKLGFRYVMPIFPWIFLFTASGLIYFYEKIKIRLVRILFVLFCFASFLYPLTYLPHSDLYYNLFVGGPKGAQNLDMVGWCTSSKPAIEYLNSINYQGTIYVAGCQTSAEYYTKIPLTRDLTKADVVVLESYFRKQRPEREVFKLLEGKTPWKTFESHGATIAEIYLIN